MRIALNVSPRLAEKLAHVMNGLFHDRPDYDESKFHFVVYGEGVGTFMEEMPTPSGKWMGKPRYEDFFSVINAGELQAQAPCDVHIHCDDDTDGFTRGELGLDYSDFLPLGRLKVLATKGRKHFFVSASPKMGQKLTVHDWSTTVRVAALYIRKSMDVHDLSIPVMSGHDDFMQRVVNELQQEAVAGVELLQPHPRLLDVKKDTLVVADSYFAGLCEMSGDINADMSAHRVIQETAGGMGILKKPFLGVSSLFVKEPTQPWLEVADPILGMNKPCFEIKDAKVSQIHKQIFHIIGVGCQAYKVAHVIKDGQ